MGSCSFAGHCAIICCGKTRTRFAEGIQRHRSSPGACVRSVSRPIAIHVVYSLNEPDPLIGAAFLRAIATHGERDYIQAVSNRVLRIGANGVIRVTSRSPHWRQSDGDGMACRRQGRSSEETAKWQMCTGFSDTISTRGLW